MAARYEYLFDLEFADLQHSWKYVNQSHLSDFFNLQIAVRDLEKKVNDQLEEFTQFVNVENTAKNSNWYNALGSDLYIVALKESFTESREICEFITFYMKDLIDEVPPNSPQIETYYKEIILRTQTSLLFYFFHVSSNNVFSRPSCNTKKANLKSK